MKQVGVREFNQNISKYLKELPIQITNRNMVVATILPGTTEEGQWYRYIDPNKKKTSK